MKDEFGDYEGGKFAASDVLTCPNCKAKDGLETESFDEETGLSLYYCLSCGTHFIGGKVGGNPNEHFLQGPGDIPIDPKIIRLSQKSARKKGLREFWYCNICGEAFATNQEVIEHQDNKGHVMPIETAFE